MYFLKKNWVVVLGLFVIGFALYAPNLRNTLFWDDNDWIVNNPYVHSLSIDNLKFIFTHDALAGIALKSNYYRPFLFLTFMFNYLIGGANPIGYHIVNNLIHIGNAIFLFLLLDKFLKKRTVAALASLLFLIHPLQTEALTYVSGRGDVLSVFMMLSALWLVIKNIETKKIWYIFGALACSASAVLSRETAFLFPLYLTVFLMAFVYRERFWKSFKSALIKALPFFGLSFAYGVLRLTALNFINTLNFYAGVSNDYTQHLSYRIYTFLHAVAVYFRLIFAPVGLHMERDIPVNVSLIQWPVWFGLLIILFIAAALFALYKKERAGLLRKSKKDTLENISAFRVWFFAFGFFFINLAPTSGVFPINALIYEHWLYFSLFGFFALLAFYLDKIFEFLKTKSQVILYFAVLIFMAYCVFLSAQTVKRNIIWGQTDKFYENILQYEPTNIRAINNLAMYYSDNNRLEDAKTLYWKAIKSNDIMPEPYYNLGNILRDQKDFAGALDLYQKAIAVNPYFSYAYLNIAAIYAEQGNLPGTLDYLEKLKAFRSQDPVVYLNLAKVQYVMGKKDEAKQAIQSALKYSVGQPDLQASAEELAKTIN